MTSKPAEVFGHERRGLLKPGYFADVVVFNPDTVLDQGTFVDPVQYPVGIENVLVNGHSVVDCGVFRPNPAGMILRRCGA